ncbi:homoserine O-acetyltransferase MetX [Sanguibacter antarcticus]|uniref:Homoserine O-acetyltransferase n=1 Tax=Sanguibacter antarcticus TaxID=372484 RepID=A0A2A9E8G2_9MICO|nr:homoserine O-acetyltransferase [Sanguibacter antarcticus]PFG35238.1 homoserine O-acetyltransferase [Sanguibacter antarcticus]
MRTGPASPDEHDDRPRGPLTQPAGWDVPARDAGSSVHWSVMNHDPQRSLPGWTRGGVPPRAQSRRAHAPAFPVSGAWREGDPQGDRRFADIGALELEAGGIIPAVRVAYETWGTLNAAGDNAVLILHALTGDSHVRGAAGPGHQTAGWWNDMVGPGAPIDTDRYFVVAPNVVGGCQGTTGPSSIAPDGRPWGSQFPVVTVRDQVAAEIELSRMLGIDAWQFVVGASMGGLRVLEWAILGPEAGIAVESIGVIASAAQTSGDQIAWAHPQLTAIHADPRFRGGDYYEAAPGDGPHVGLGIARQIAHTTYRSAVELDERFGRIPQGGEDPMRGGRFAVQSYLDHHASKLARRFDANSYVVLTESMLTHDLGRDRGGVMTALRSITARTLVVAVETDRLFLPAESRRIADLVPGAEPAHVLRSDLGHDGFLIEFDQLGPLVVDFLARATRSGA